MNSLFKITSNSTDSLVWHTWSDHIRAKLAQISNELLRLNTSIVNVSPLEQYGLSYSVKSVHSISSDAKDVVSEVATLLISLDPKDGIYFLDNLTFYGFTSDSLHVLFSLVSEEIRKIMEDGSCSLHSPIEEQTVDAGFPVHADLFRMKGLFNVISHIGKECGGDITLLSITSLDEAMDCNRNLPECIRNTILSAMKSRVDGDMFNEVYDLMYGDHIWVSDLKNEIEKRQIRIPAREGVGYMLIDGLWLHGRTAIQGPVSSNRLQRLVFNTLETRKLPVISRVAKDCGQYVGREKIITSKSKSLKSIVCQGM